MTGTPPTVRESEALTGAFAALEIDAPGIVADVRRRLYEEGAELFATHGARHFLDLADRALAAETSEAGRSSWRMALMDLAAIAHFARPLVRLTVELHPDHVAWLAHLAWVEHLDGGRASIFLASTVGEDPRADAVRVLHQLAEHAGQGARRPASWESTWLRQVLPHTASAGVYSRESVHVLDLPDESDALVDLEHLIELIDFARADAEVLDELGAHVLTIGCEMDEVYPHASPVAGVLRELVRALSRPLTWPPSPATETLIARAKRIVAARDVLRDVPPELPPELPLTEPTPPEGCSPAAMEEA